MNAILQIGNHTLTAEEIIPLLASYKLIPQLLCELIIDQAIVQISYTPEEIALAYQEFDRHWGLTSEAERQAWGEQCGLNQEQLKLLVTRRLRVEKFKESTWGSQLRSYFSKRKKQLDRVVYSLIQTKDNGIATELYFRLQEREQSFAELAREYSKGSEALTNGLMGPVELGTLHPTLAYLLSSSQISEIRPPVSVGEWQIIVRVEKFIPAQFNDLMRQRLLQEKFEAWFQEQVKQLSYQEQIWMGITPRNQLELTDKLAAA
ncbi:peptidylprolyl isomerase [Pleurocapsa sp. PCC 7319]|uniref:peptidylprolyl isomerase n=1 Tax=Pleurocapsa sp. PCC 7319 TaxID=118161 RepID=UPI00034891E9|nr:peptidylprolyl isomerase [Pleurocapsa sp. PCC 7319]